MKKLSFLLAMVFAASMAMAQHTDIVNQTGSDNKATVDQSFMPTPGPGLPGNEAFVDQIGNRNKADVDQLNGGYAGDAHWAKVYTKGNDNFSKIYQERAAGDAIIYQEGNLNSADIFQSGNFNAGSPLNNLYDAFAMQIGNSNKIDIEVWGTNATAYAEQKGDDNKIDQQLGSAMGEKVENSDFQARQFGNRNKATQKMDGEGFAGSIKAVENFGDIYQDGNDNTAKQLMNEDVVLGAATYNSATAYQDGNNNNSEQYQTGGHNSSTHSQIGNGNSEITHQN